MKEKQGRHGVSGIFIVLLLTPFPLKEAGGL